MVTIAMRRMNELRFSKTALATIPTVWSLMTSFENTMVNLLLDDCFRCIAALSESRSSTVWHTRLQSDDPRQQQYY